MQKSSTSAPVEEAVNAISWVHQVGVVEDPTQKDLVKQVLAGAKRMLAHRTNKKEPITTEILAKLADQLAGEDSDLADVRLMTICLVGFSGFCDLTRWPPKRIGCKHLSGPYGTFH